MEKFLNILVEKEERKSYHQKPGAFKYLMADEDWRAKKRADERQNDLKLWRSKMKNP